ncbi:MAG TPA: tetratricopeptide repeat protein, partial [Bacteroidia bacterium]|nr:tetratricopeptide repeat protein [Bacteroidia bacterium]
KILENAHNPKKLSAIYNNIAVVYLELHQYKDAENYFNKSLKIDETLADSIGIAESFNNIATVYQSKLKFDTALIYNLKALRIRELIKDKQGLPSTLTNIGIVYMNTKNYVNSNKYLIKGLQFYKENADSMGVALAYANLGDLNESEKFYTNSIAYYDSSVTISKKNKYLDYLSYNYEHLSSVCSEMKNFEKALDYHKLFMDIKDTIFNKDNAQQLAEMETKYKTEKKEKELIKSQAESEKQANLKNIFIIGFILMIGLTFFIFKNYREKQKANEIITAQKIEVEHQKTIVEEKNKDITDSIYYARRIQRALLTSETYLKKNLPDYFILYQPKDIVSGDFYWALNTENNFFIATADCTGHGVPGAFMSMLGINFLSEIIIEKKMLEPNKIMNELRQNIIHALNPEDTQEEAKDGMDMVLCAFDFKNKKLKVATANNPVWIIRKNENETPFIEEIKPDKFPVGKHDQDNVSFTAHEISLSKGDIIYTFTDGYADQFGGPKGKKFKYKPLQELLLANCHKSMEEQQKIIHETLVDWKGNLEQVDDILLIGIKV